ncbi:DUF3788 family protein [Holdemania filiformis]|uniref:DUF3788 family protein n=1 Tax=Holdemania filiformis TaxID=61171 RepID=A0A412FM49_9FIRM|nr:DUF3788 family protein [Holdemania filiformis]MBS5001231.1 DUF3788 family protein [Holdemania filiformis]RGR69206.1 DUF3788 family protein [Holdemania filiformis]
MFERMLEGGHRPTPEEIQNTLGREACAHLARLETRLADLYDLRKELRFPFGKDYGWGIKYSHKAVHLAYAFLEQGAFTVMLQIGDGRVPVLKECLSSLSDKAQSLWENRYPCGEEGGWIRYRILKPDEIEEVLRLIAIKKAPPKKR